MRGRIRWCHKETPRTTALFKMDQKLEHKFYQVFRCSEYGLEQSETAEARLSLLLRKMPGERAGILLNDFEKNIRANKDKIRNPTAYLMGMANRVIEALDIPDSIRVQHELDRIYSTGKIRPDDIDERCRDALKQLPEKSAMDALRELDTADITTIVNISAFFMGVLRKYEAGAGGGSGGSRRDMGGNDGYNQSPRRNEGGNYGRDRDMGRDIGRGMGRDMGGSYPPVQRAVGGFPPPFLPAPGAIPRDLLYGFGDQEYRPEMPRILEGTFLPPPVQDQLEGLIRRGVLRPDDLDARVLNELRTLPEDFAITVAKEFTSLDRGSVRNVSNYLLGITRRVSQTLEMKTGVPVGGGPGAMDFNASRVKRPLDFDNRPPLQQQPPSYYGNQGGRDMRYGGGDRRGGGGGFRDMDPLSKRYRVDDMMAPSRYDPPPAMGGRAPYGVPPGVMGEDNNRMKVDIEIDRNVRAGVIRHEDIDDRVRDYLAAQTPWIASKAIADFCAKDMNRINNKSNFLKGIVRKLVEKEAEMSSGGGAVVGMGMGRGSMGGGGGGGGYRGHGADMGRGGMY